MNKISKSIAALVVVNSICGATVVAQDLSETLNEAVLFNDPVAVRAALDQGADPNEAVNNRSPLGWAAQNASVEIVDILIAAGANPNSMDAIGQTPLMRAIDSGKSANAASLIRAGADVNHKTTQNRTVGMVAAEAGDLALVEALLEAGADFDVMDDYGDFALMIAIRNGVDQLPGIITALGRGGANLDQSGGAYTALYYAAEQGDLATAKALLAAGASPDAKTENGSAPLIKSLYYPEIFELLIDAGADPNITDRWGQPAIYAILNDGTPEMLERLIEAGADVRHESDDGQTPLNRAEFGGNEEMVAILRKHGAGGGSEEEMETATAAAPAGGKNWLATIPTLEPIDPPTRFSPSMHYQSTASALEALDHYDTHLGQLGWERGRTDNYGDTYILAEYKFGAELLSLSLSEDQGTPPKLTVSATPLGTISAATLPRYPGTEVLYEAGLTAMYVSPDKADTVANETLKLLEQDGWAGGFAVERGDHFVLEMTKEGTTLNASIGVAAGQDGRTTIQYVVLKEG